MFAKTLVADIYSKGVVWPEWSSALDESSVASDQHSVGSSPGLDTCVLKQDT